MALRRAVIDALVKGVHEDGNITVPRYFTISLVYNSLPETSPLCSFLAEVYVNHWNIGLDRSNVCPEENKHRNHAPSHFLSAVMAGISHRVLEGVETEDDCRCCHKTCDFHEHESDEERIASRSMP